jgi:hypothetical protein
VLVVLEIPTHRVLVIMEQALYFLLSHQLEVVVADPKVLLVHLELLAVAAAV